MSNLPFLNPGPDLSQIFGALQNIVSGINNLQQTVLRDSQNIVTAIEAITPAPLRSSVVFNPPSIASGAQTTTTVTVAGAVLGTYAEATFSLDLSGLIVTAYVSAANTVTVIFANLTAGPIDLASGTLSVKVSA